MRLPAQPNSITLACRDVERMADLLYSALPLAPCVVTTQPPNRHTITVTLKPELGSGVAQAKRGSVVASDGLEWA